MDANFNLPLNYPLVLDDREYKIIDCIGSGGSSKVYKAKNLTTGYYVLIKELFPADTNERKWGGIRNKEKLVIPEEYENDFENLKERTRREVQTVYSLKIENTIKNGGITVDNSSWFQKYHGPYEANNTLYSVIDSNSGDTLYDIMSAENKAKNFKNFTDICECILRILEALEPMHLKGYLHLDISPDNIYVLKQEVDGKRIHNLIDFNSAYNIKSTEKSNIKFTYKKGYSAPELEDIGSAADVKDGDLKDATDLYSVVAIFFELLTGRLYNDDEHHDEDEFTKGANVVNGEDKESYLFGMSSLLRNCQRIS